MNLYEVVSETLYKSEYMDYGPPEPYCIAELVVARNPSQARYLAWKTDNDFTYDLTEMPAFSVHLCMKNMNEKKAHTVTREEKYQGCWTPGRKE
jgi:hypothetical protein